MDTLSYKTVSANKETVKKDWYVVDATNQVLGRLSSKIAKVLRGKHKADFTPHVDSGDNVIIINAEKIRLTGKKMNDKQYVRHTGYPGGQRFINPKDLLVKSPTKVIYFAVKGMMPKNRLSDSVLKNLYIYAGSEHNHQAQNPKELNLNTI